MNVASRWTCSFSTSIMTASHSLPQGRRRQSAYSGPFPARTPAAPPRGPAPTCGAIGHIPASLRRVQPCVSQGSFRRARMASRRIRPAPFASRRPPDAPARPASARRMVASARAGSSGARRKLEGARGSVSRRRRRGARTRQSLSRANMPASEVDLVAPFFVPLALFPAPAARSAETLLPTFRRASPRRIR